jgi:hypothetical protein
MCSAVCFTYDSEKLVVMESDVVRVPIREHVPPDVRAGEFWLCNRRPDRLNDTKNLQTKVTEDDPLLVFLKRMNGNVMRPVEHKPAAIEARNQHGTPER